MLRPPLLLVFRVCVCCCHPESCLRACSGAGPRLCAARNPSSLTNSLTHTISLPFESSPELSAHVSGTQPGMGRVRRIVCVGVEKEPQRRRCFSGDCHVPWPETYPHRAARAWYLVHAVVWAVAVVVHSRWGGGGCRERGWKRALGVYTIRKIGCTHALGPRVPRCRAWGGIKV